MDFTKKIFGSDRKRSALRYAFDNQKGFDDFVIGSLDAFKSK